MMHVAEWHSASFKGSNKSSVSKKIKKGSRFNSECFKITFHEILTTPMETPKNSVVYIVAPWDIISDLF